jgi:hypothetical protein
VSLPVKEIAVETLAFASVGALAAELTLRVNEIHIYDRSEALLPAAGFAAATAISLRSLPKGSPGARALSGGASALAGLATLALLLRLLSGHFPWDERWPPASFVLARGLLGLARGVVVIAVAFAAGRVSAGPVERSRSLAGPVVTALALGVPLLLRGELAIWLHVLACVPLVLAANGVSACARRVSPISSTSSSSSFSSS